MRSSKHLNLSHRQQQALKSLTTAPNSNFNPKMAENKQKIKHTLKKFRNLKEQQRHLDLVLEAKQNERIMLQAQYDRQITALRIIGALADNTEEIDYNAPLYEELRTMIDKMEIMRRVLLKLLMVRSAIHDWLAAPHQRYAVLKLARAANTVEEFIRDHNSDLDD